MEEFGFNDIPTNSDLVEVKNYISGLLDFITACPTPMTIAIQGDWGTGKTSAMQALHQLLDKDNNYWQIDFNTWQYAQFDLGNQLVFSLITTILTDLDSQLSTQKSNNNKFAAKLSEDIKKIYGVVKQVVFATARTALSTTVPGGKIVLSAVDASVNNIQKAKVEASDEESANDVVDIDPSIKLITNLRSSLQEIVQTIITAKPETHGFQGPNRIIIYIDDLDRLAPERAVAIMEAIKVFLDVKGCVFVLAIDFAVVLRGVREKYGHDFSEDKARAFFDKIIQVPFNLPVGAYNVTKLLNTGLKSIGVSASEDEIDNFEVLIQNSAGRNPRSIKRLMNTFGLIKKIGNSILNDNSRDASPNIARDIHVFAILCLQTSYPDVFAELTRPQSLEGRSSKWDEIKSAAEQDTEESRTWREKFGVNEYKEDAFASFIETVDGIFARSLGKKFNAELFNDALVRSAITAVGTTETAGTTTLVPFRASAIKSLETRLSALQDSHKLAAKLAPIFEKTLKSILGEIEAGDTGKYWSYEASAKSNLSERIKGKRFLELHYKQYGLNPIFGNYLTYEAGDKIIAEMSKRFQDDIDHSHSKKSKPPCSISRITTEEQARYAAELIANAYLDSSNYV